MAARTEDEIEFIHGGVTVSVLSQIFGISTPEVNRRIGAKVKPYPAKPNEQLKYSIRAAAPFLVDVQLDLEEALKTVSPSKIPPMLSDIFWKGQLSRQKYEENRGDLWRTEVVIETFAEVAKVIRMTILMFSDNVAAQEELTPAQRKLIIMMSDNLLVTLFDSLVEHFKDYKARDDEHGPPPDAALVEAEKEDDEPYDDGLG